MVRDMLDYAVRVFHRIDFICGGVVAILYFSLAGEIGVGNHRDFVTFVIVLVALAEGGYGVYRQEHAVRVALCFPSATFGI